MFFPLIAALLSVGLFVAMSLCSEIGRRIGTTRLARDPEALSKGTGTAEAAVLGLLGLLIAFTFSGAAARFEARRHLIVDEANAIGTAYLRIDLLSADAQPEIRDLFRRYADLRATAYRDSLAASRARVAESAALQSVIWQKAVTSSQEPDAAPQAAMLLLPALNEMIDITSTRQMATDNHPPLVILFLLGVLSLVGAIIVGYGTATSQRRAWFHTVGYAIILSITVYVIIDLEYPRFGLIRIDSADEMLVAVRLSMQ
jgi:hypothetical protein